MFYVADSELLALFITTNDIEPLSQNLTKMGCYQPRSDLHISNSTASGVTNNTIVPKLTNSMDTNFHWIRCRNFQFQLYYYWASGISNISD